MIITRSQIRRLERKVDHLMTAVESLEAAVASLEADESAAAAEFATLAAEIKELKAGTITEPQIQALADKAAAVGSALKAATPEGKIA